MASHRILRVAGKVERLEQSALRQQQAAVALQGPGATASRRARSSSAYNPSSRPSVPSPVGTTRALTPSYLFRSGFSRYASTSASTAPAAATSPSTSSTSTPPIDDPESAVPTQDLTEGLSDDPLILDEGGQQVDWARSFNGLGMQPFSKEISNVLLEPMNFDDVEVKPDGIIYLPEIKYRRILNRAFGPGGWGLAPRSETIVTSKLVTREYALVAHGRLMSVARGEQEYFNPEGITTAAEGCKSNAMMRCCKDLGVASELWDPRWIQKFLKDQAKEMFVEHGTTKRRRKIWLRKEDTPKYPFKEVKNFSGSS